MLRTASVFLSVIVLALLVGACSGKKNPTVAASTLQAPTLVPTAVPTVIATAVPVAAIDGNWSYSESGQSLWSMGVVTRNDGSVLGYAQRRLTPGSVTASQYFVMTDYGSGLYEGQLYINYSTSCTDQLYVIWDRTEENTLGVSLSCESCSCGLIPRHWAGTYWMHR